MKVELVKPEPVEDDVVITMSRTEAETLKYFTGELSEFNVMSLLGGEASLHRAAEGAYALTEKLYNKLDRLL